MSGARGPHPLADPADPVDVFRNALGMFATGIVVVTATHREHGPVGMTANSFSSVSLTPPLVLFCVAHTSTTWPSIRASGRFCVNVLTRGQEDLSRHEAGDHTIVVGRVDDLAVDDSEASPLLYYRNYRSGYAHLAA